MNIFVSFLVLAFGAAVSHTIDGVPFVKQETQYCGPASLSSVMAYYGDPVDQETIGEAVYCPKLKGALITDLENYAKKRGFQTKIGRGGTSDIREFLSRNKPVIVLVDLGFWIMSKQHFLVVYGYNEQGFLAHDGYNKEKLFLYERFANIWSKMGNTFLLVYR